MDTALLISNLVKGYNMFNLFNNKNNNKVLLVILIVSFLASSLGASTKEKSIEYWDKEFRNLSIQERSALIKTFVKAIPYDLSYTLTAIHFKETYGDRYFFNINSATNVDVGSFQINSAEYLRRQNLKINKWNTARAMEELRDYDLNFSQAILTMDSCLKKSKGDWRKAWGYYNQWSNGGNKAYSKDIYNIIQVLKKYFSTELYNKHRAEYKE